MCENGMQEVGGVLNVVCWVKDVRSVGVRIWRRCVWGVGSVKGVVIS